MKPVLTEARTTLFRSTPQPLGKHIEVRDLKGLTNQPRRLFVARLVSMIVVKAVQKWHFGLIYWHHTNKQNRAQRACLFQQSRHIGAESIKISEISPTQARQPRRIIHPHR